jgi:hypothetical protein
MNFYSKISQEQIECECWHLISSILVPKIISPFSTIQPHRPPPPRRPPCSRHNTLPPRSKRPSTPTRRHVPNARQSQHGTQQSQLRLDAKLEKDCFRVDYPQYLSPLFHQQCKHVLQTCTASIPIFYAWFILSAPLTCPRTRARSRRLRFSSSRRSRWRSSRTQWPSPRRRRARRSPRLR